MLTWRAYGLLLMGIPLAFGLDVTGGHWVSISGILAWDISVLGAIVYDRQRSRPRRIKVTRDPLSRLSVGRENKVHLHIQAGSQPVQLTIRDAYPESFQSATLVLSATLEPDQQRELTYTVVPSQRGSFEWGALYNRQLSPWQLVWDSWPVPQTQTVDVYPDLLGLKALSIRLTQQSSGSLRRARRIGLGTEFAELREYARGDDPRLIDWKSTARRSRPLVRVLEPEQEQTLIILLDRGRLMTARVQGLRRFDWGLNTTLALALAGLQRGDQVAVGVFDRRMHTWIPSVRGYSHFSHLVERLTPLQPDWIEPDYLGTVTTVVKQQQRRALVVMITDLVDATASEDLLVAMMQLSPRYLPFCVALRDPLLDQQAHTFTDDVSQAYNRAVALDLLSQRAHAFSHLKQKGVLVLDAPADQMSTQLVDRYLELKLYNKL